MTILHPSTKEGKSKRNNKQCNLDKLKTDIKKILHTNPISHPRKIQQLRIGIIPPETPKQTIAKQNPQSTTTLTLEPLTLLKT